jgi:light-regulated signal transduction histidine kinase (bacteriophytochrome)
VPSRDELRDLAESFNRMSRELHQRTSELSRSNHELEQFAHLASHDLQEPLRMVSSYLQILQMEFEGKLGAEADEYIRYAVEGALRMKKLIDSLLSYSRLGRSGQKFEMSDFNQIVKHALENLKVSVEEHRAFIRAEPLPKAMADPILMTELFQNLIGNAIKFKGESLPEVRVAARDAGREWIFSVRDNGIGIDPKHFESIFVIFKRLHSREKYPGTGIGLASCKKIVDIHGGKIWVESNAEGAGSTFYFTIPKGGETR